MAEGRRDNASSKWKGQCHKITEGTMLQDNWRGSASRWLKGQCFKIIEWVVPQDNFCNWKCHHTAVIEGTAHKKCVRIVLLYLLHYIFKKILNKHNQGSRFLVYAVKFLTVLQHNVDPATNYTSQNGACTYPSDDAYLFHNNIIGNCRGSSISLPVYEVWAFEICLKENR